MNKLNITVIERESNSESPMVGTLIDVSETDPADYLVRLGQAFIEHYSCSLSDITFEMEAMTAFETLFAAVPYEDITIEIKDYGKNLIRLTRTWIY